jgi:hypothetical protein
VRADSFRVGEFLHALTRARSRASWALIPFQSSRALLHRGAPLEARCGAQFVIVSTQSIERASRISAMPAERSHIERPSAGHKGIMERVTASDHRVCGGLRVAFARRPTVLMERVACPACENGPKEGSMADTQAEGQA